MISFSSQHRRRPLPLGPAFRGRDGTSACFISGGYTAGKGVEGFLAATSTPEAGDGKRFILGPTALTIAIHGPAVIQGDSIVLDYHPPIDTSKPLPDNLSSIAQTSIALLRQRLTAVQQISLDEFTANPTQELPDTDHDYVLESAMQIVQMRDQPLWFINKHSLGDEEVREITALEAISRPAVVVDGQHRLFGAADANAAIGSGRRNPKLSVG